MPEIGGKKFAEDFKTMLQTQIAKAIEDGRKTVQSAADGLAETIREQSRGAARVINEEAQAVRDAFQPITGNNPPEGADGDPTKPKEGGGG